MVNEVKFRLEDFIKEIREKFRDKRIGFSHAKYRFELEIPDEHVKKIPDTFEFTSQKNGFKRYHTPEIKEMVEELEAAEEVLKNTMIPFLCDVFSLFHQQK